MQATASPSVPHRTSGIARFCAYGNSHVGRCRGAATTRHGGDRRTYSVDSAHAAHHTGVLPPCEWHASHYAPLKEAPHRWSGSTGDSVGDDAAIGIRPATAESYTR